MRLAVIVPLGDRPRRAAESLRALGELRRRGHWVIAVNGAATGIDSAVGALADRVVYAPAGWSRQVNAGSRAPEVELADALVFLPEGVHLPPQADRSIARALANSTSPWGRFDIRYHASPGPLRWPVAIAAALANAVSRLTGICTREQAIFVSRGAFLALDGFTPVNPCADAAADGAADAEFSRRAGQLGRPILLHDRALAPVPAQDARTLLRVVWRQELRRVRIALGMTSLAWTEGHG
jgi:hypothetical protein